jgi:hypothetical protein
MKKLFTMPLLILALTVIAQTAYAQGFPYHLYDTRTMAELVELNSVAEENQVIGKTQIAVSAKPFYSAVRMEYMGQNRNLSERKLGFYKIWAEALDVKTDSKYNVLDIIQKEYLFKECDKEYWITVQTPAANDFPKDMRKGDRITLYMMVIGGIKYEKEDWDYMFLTNSFKVY